MCGFIAQFVEHRLKDFENLRRLREFLARTSVIVTARAVRFVLLPYVHVVTNFLVIGS